MKIDKSNGKLRRPLVICKDQGSNCSSLHDTDKALGELINFANQTSRMKQANQSVKNEVGVVFFGGGKKSQAFH